MQAVTLTYVLDTNVVITRLGTRHFFQNDTQLKTHILTDVRKGNHANHATYNKKKEVGARAANYF